MKWIFLILFFFTTSNIYSQNERWKLLEGFAQDYEFYYDTETIAIKDNVIDVWIKYYPLTKKYESGRGYLESGITHFIIYCDSKSYREYNLINYYTNGKHYDEDVDISSNIKPETLAEKLYRVFCN